MNKVDGAVVWDLDFLSGSLSPWEFLNVDYVPWSHCFGGLDLKSLLIPDAPQKDPTF